MHTTIFSLPNLNASIGNPSRRMWPTVCTKPLYNICYNVIAHRQVNMRVYMRMCVLCMHVCCLWDLSALVKRELYENGVHPLTVCWHIGRHATPPSHRLSAWTLYRNVRGCRKFGTILAVHEYFYTHTSHFHLNIETLIRWQKHSLRHSL